MGNIVELKRLVKDTLNNNCLDPYDTGSTRLGNQFFDEADGLNLTRANTFPKGFLKGGPGTSPVRQNIGSVGHSKNYGTIDIFYFVKEKNNYTNSSVRYTDQDLVLYMLKNIQDVLLNNNLKEHGYYMSPNSIVSSGDIIIDRDTRNTFKLYRGLITITYYWDEVYG